MPLLPADGSLVVVDACCWINLLATGRLEDILAALPYRWAASAYVADEEVLTALKTQSAQPEVLVLRDLERLGLVTVHPVASALEVSEFVRFAAHLDDGEASICAVAVVHGGCVATDDRKALRVLGLLVPQVPTIQTPQLLERWAEITRQTGEALRAVLEQVERNARFAPREGVPAAAWWIRSRG